MNERASLNLPNQIQMMLNGSIPPPPIANLIGFQVISIDSGKAVIEFEAGERHANPMGTLHGGVLCDSRNGYGLRKYVERGGELHHTGTENQLP